MTVLILCLVGQPANDAEQLFHRMEEKLAKAQTIELVFEGRLEITEGKESINLRREGSLLLGEGNKMRLEMKEGAKGETMWRLVICDGVRMKVLDEGSDPQVQNAAKSGNSEVLAWISRAGVLLPQLPLPPVEATDGKDRYRIAGLRLTKKEKVGERESQRLEYQLIVKEHPGSFSVVVWLDTKTDLPVKRVVTSQIPGNMATVTESYTKLTLDEKVDARKFEVPK